MKKVKLNNEVWTRRNGDMPNKLFGYLSSNGRFAVVGEYGTINSPTGCYVGAAYLVYSNNPNSEFNTLSVEREDTVCWCMESGVNHSLHCGLL
jgi:hypothetical protein